MTKAAAQSPAVARLPMANQGQRLGEDGTNPGDVLVDLYTALPRSASDGEPICPDRDAVEPGHLIDVDKVVRIDVAEVQHRHQRLPARQHLGVIEPRQ